jgi:hypothetical protein
VALAMLVGAIWFFSRPTLLVIASAYLAHGLMLQLVRIVRHRTASRHA